MCARRWVIGPSQRPGWSETFTWVRCWRTSAPVRVAIRFCQRTSTSTHLKSAAAARLEQPHQPRERRAGIALRGSARAGRAPHPRTRSRGRVPCPRSRHSRLARHGCLAGQQPHPISPRGSARTPCRGSTTHARTRIPRRLQRKRLPCLSRLLRTGPRDQHGPESAEQLRPAGGCPLSTAPRLSTDAPPSRPPPPAADRLEQGRPPGGWGLRCGGCAVGAALWGLRCGGCAVVRSFKVRVARG